MSITLVEVIAETDQALATLLRTRVFGDAPIGVSFDPPSRPWIQALKSPVVNLFLFDLRENAARRDSAPAPIRDDHGVVVGHRTPMQRWDLHYTVSVFAPRIVVEHRILAGALRYFAQLTVIPEDALPAALAETGYPVLVSTGAGAKRGMFLNYAGDIKAAFEMTVTVPIPPLEAPAAPAVQRPATLVVGPAGSDEPGAKTGSPESVQSGRPPDPDPAPRATGAPAVPADH